MSLKLEGQDATPCAQANYIAASLIFFKERTFTRTVAGLAANSRSTFVNGSIPRRFFFAGTACEVIFKRPGKVNSPRPFLLSEATIVASSAANTALTALGSTPATSARCAWRVVLLKTVLIGFSGATNAAPLLARGALREDAGGFFDVGDGFVAAVDFLAVAMSRVLSMDLERKPRCSIVETLKPQYASPWRDRLKLLGGDHHRLRPVPQATNPSVCSQTPLETPIGVEAASCGDVAVLLALCIWVKR